MRHSQDCLGAGDPCCYGSLAPADAFAHPAPSPSAAHAEVQQGYSADDLPCEKHGATICEPCAYDRGFAAGRAASPSPVSCEHCGLPWGDGTAHATTAWACDPPAASPSPGEVEAAFREGWRNAYENTDPELGGHGCDEYWLASAARRGAAGGQDASR